jgi:hypothetical protein
MTDDTETAAEELIRQVIDAIEAERSIAPIIATAMRELVAKRDAEIADAQAQTKELTGALRAIMGYIGDGTFVRDTSHDADPDWAVKLVWLVMALKRADILTTDQWEGIL